MKLEDARAIANEVKEALLPCCERIEIAGSVRRQKPEVNDIDVVAQPFDMDAFNCAVKYLLQKVMLDGPKIKRGIYKGAEIDLYVASDATFETLLLIRTGSKEHNIRLTSLAKKKGMKLHASGLGLEDQHGNIVAQTEVGIFGYLGLDYLPPEKREWRLTTP